MIRESARQFQTRFGVEPGTKECGNCFSTCIACLFDLCTETVPNFCASTGDWWQELNDWLLPRGWTAVLVRGGDWLREIPRQHPGLTYIAGGKSPRGTDHCVLMRDGRLLHDPHPEGLGLVSVEDATLLVPLAWPVPEDAPGRDIRKDLSLRDLGLSFRSAEDVAASLARSGVRLGEDRDCFVAEDFYTLGHVVGDCQGDGHFSCKKCARWIGEDK